MTLITTSSNAEDLSMTLVAEFDAAPERVWNLWADPRKLERWYGPQPYPAFFTRYEFEPGGQCRISSRSAASSRSSRSAPARA